MLYTGKTLLCAPVRATQNMVRILRQIIVCIVLQTAPVSMRYQRKQQLHETLQFLSYLCQDRSSRKLFGLVDQC